MGPHLTIEDRCDNWGSVYRWHAAVSVVRDVQGGKVVKHYYAKIGSLENNWRSPQPWDRVPTKPPAPDVADAQDVESAVVTLGGYQHTILRGWYVYRLADVVCMRLAEKAGNLPNQRQGWAKTLDGAHLALQAALSLPRAIRRERARDRVQAVFAAMPLDMGE